MPKKDSKNTKNKKIKETEKKNNPSPIEPEEIEKSKPENFYININKALAFDNTSEIIAKNILDIIVLNLFNEIAIKKLDTLVVQYCFDYVKKELNNFLSLNYLCHEKEKSFLNEIELFNDNFIRNESNEECNILQPLAPQLDRWKIHKANIVKIKDTFFDTNKNNKLKEKKLGKKNLRKITKKATIIINNENNNEKKKRKKEKTKAEINVLIDSFPSFPLADSIFKRETYLTKEQEKQIDLLREEILIKEELQKKEEERKMKRFEYFQNGFFDVNNIKDLEERKKYFKGKNIGVTVNGDIIIIKNIDIRNLQSEFLKGVSKMKKDNETPIISENKNLDNINKIKNEEIEKNRKNDDYIDFFREVNKNRFNKEFTVGGFSFDKFIPETGVNLKQGKIFKSGGNDYMNKYKKISYDQFERTLEKFTKINHEKNGLIQILKEDDNITPISNKETIENNNLHNYTNNTIKNKTIYNLNFSNNINKIKNAFQRSSSLPDVFTPRNTNSRNSRDKNDLIIKKKFYLTNYNYNSSGNFTSTLYNNKNDNNYNNKFIKTSSSFRDLFTKDELNIEDNNKIISTKTSTNFFKNFKNYKILSKPKRTFISLRKMQTFNSDILNNKDWGLASNKEKEINNWNIMPNKNIVKNILDKNNFRIRSNLNEIYLNKMNNEDILSFVKTGNNFNKKIKLKKNGTIKIKQEI